MHINRFNQFCNLSENKIQGKTIINVDINECLKEVEIALMSLDKKYDTIEQFVY